MRAQRLRVTFGRGAELRYITHLDLMRFWERALRRAAVDVAYSEGFSPHAQLSLAAPLPVGITGRAELMDVFLATRSTPEIFISMLAPQLPPGLSLHDAEEIELSRPSMQSQLRAAEYAVELPAGADHAAISARVLSLLERTTIPWQHMREREVRSYDLRPLIRKLSFLTGTDSATLSMNLRMDNSGSGRPDQVLTALDLPNNLPIERVRLVLSDDDVTASDADGASTTAVVAQ